MKRLTTYCLLMCLFVGSATAQKARLERANKEFELLNYSQAIEIYQEILDKTDIPEAKIKLAESYRKVDNMAEAEYWYGQIVHLPDAKPEYFLFYGQALQANGKCDLAKEWFEKYNQTKGSEIRAANLVTTCDKETIDKLIRSRKDFYEISHLPFNSKFDDLGPVFYKDGIVFSSERGKTGVTKRIHEWTGFPFLDLFYAKVDTINAVAMEFNYEEDPGKYGERLNTKFHDGPICFNRDQTKVFFTRNNIDGRNRVGKDDEGIIRLKIFSAQAQNGGWSALEGMPFNSDEYSVAHPALSPDGNTLYFSSDMPGGFGGMDLYQVRFDNGQWSPPKNMGPSINTEGDEVFPRIQPETGRMFFSSNGHVGLGGLDVFFMDNNEGVWGPIQNMGWPINSIADDHGLIMNEEETFGYFVSRRDGGVGRDDIYSFKYAAVKMEVLVYDKYTGEPISNAAVFNDCSETTLQTGTNGKVMFDMPLNKCCSFAASKTTYEDNQKDTCTNGMKAGDRLLVKIPLIQPLDFAIEGVVYNARTGLPMADSKVTLMPDCGGAPVVVATGTNGEYRFVLDRNCCYSLKAEKPTYLAVSTDNPYCTRGLRASKTFIHDFYLQKYIENPNQCDTCTTVAGPGGPGYPNNGGTENTGTPTIPCDIPVNFVLEHIYYDFDRAYIRSDAEEPLADLMKILRDNPDLVVEIGSHTDARGSNRYNDRLSERRAKSVVKYLIGRGIAENRLEWKGYGETQPTNECIDYVPCDEEKHQRNRRTEFRVVGLIDGTRFNCDEGMISVDKVSIEPIILKKIDRCENCPF